MVLIAGLASCLALAPLISNFQFRSIFFDIRYSKLEGCASAGASWTLNSAVKLDHNYLKKGGVSIINLEGNRRTPVF